MAVLGEVPGQGTVYRQGGVSQREQLHQGARPRDGHDHEGPGRPGRGVLRIPRTEPRTTHAAPWPPEHGREAPGQGRVGVNGGALPRPLGAQAHSRRGPLPQGPPGHDRAKIAPAACANRRGTLASGGSSFIRERARALGMSMRELAEKAGVSYGYLSQVSRGQSRKNMGVKTQARVEGTGVTPTALDGPAKVAPAGCAAVDPQALWERMNAHGISQERGRQALRPASPGSRPPLPTSWNGKSPKQHARGLGVLKRRPTEVVSTVTTYA